MTNPNIEGLDEALAQVRAEGHAAGRAEGYAAGREEAGAILAHSEAEGRSKAAAELAGDPMITTERAISLLQLMPKEKSAGTNFKELMQGKAPDVGPGDTPEPTEAELRQARIAELKGFAANASSRR